jgi:hypothetical protein
MRRHVITPLLILMIVLFGTSLAHAQLGTTTATTTLNVTVSAEAALTVGASTNLASTGSNFSNYTGSTSLTYFIRTSQSSGTGSIVVEVTSDFSPAGGPSVATPPTAGDALKYTCTASQPGNR